MMQLPRLGRFVTAWWLTALIASALVVSLHFVDVTDRLDDIAYDTAQSLTGRNPDPRILLVNIDDQSLAKYGKWPWPRAVHADLIDRLASGAPRAILYDILFLDPGPDDNKLAAAMKRAGNVHIPLLLEPTNGNGLPFTPKLPAAPIRDAAAGLGHVNLIKDDDGVVRDIHLVEHNGRAAFPHLVIGVAHKLAGPGATDLPSPSYLIPYAGGAGTFRSISASALLGGEIPDNLLKDRLIIVGGTAEGLGDLHTIANSSAEGLISGVELQANVLDGLINGIVIVEAGRPARIAFALVPLWLMLVGFRLLRSNLTLPALTLLSAATIAASLLFFHFFGLWIPPVAALIGLCFAYLFWAWRRLAAISKHMVRELDRLRSDTEYPKPFAHETNIDDPITRETVLLSDAVSELRSMRHFLSQSLDQLPDAVFVTDGSGNIILQNQRAEQLSRLVGASNPVVSIGEILDRLNSPDIAFKMKTWPPAREDLSQELQSKDGRIYDLRITEYRNNFSGLDGWIVRLSDISDVRTAQRQRDEMLDFLTHDMRTPQIAILALTAAADDKDIAPQLARRIDRYARRTLDLADDVVHLTRARNLHYEPVPIDLATILIEAIEELWPQIQARRIKIEKQDVDGCEYLVAGEPTLLMRAMVNLIDNAVKYGRDGGHIRCRMTRRHDGGTCNVHCSINDDGIGIPAAKLASMFERFQRGASDAGASGAGLGLSLVEAVVIRHNGRIICESKEGMGSTFTIRLPLIA